MRLHLLLRDRLLCVPMLTGTCARLNRVSSFSPVLCCILLLWVLGLLSLKVVADGWLKCVIASCNSNSAAQCTWHLKGSAEVWLESAVS